MFEIEKVIKINAPKARVFQALTSSNEIPKYYPLNEVVSTWEVGSEVLYKGEINGSPFTDYGVIESLNEPGFYSYRYWSDNHGTERTSENYILISYALSEIPEGTELKLVQSNIRSEELYNLMETQVWDFLLGALKEYVEPRT
ncbi:SRPBCC family protein [Marinobacterium arenosum]|uniref:SRPBCC family protein n=1 Tax=Marinobacterium arenosum TaxID=2862496 RepID=UPI001C9612C2|nr:SRPBCC domain-containing protein [Marinobacterium arenosum]MBY4677417.1 SRPBCC domain-containing protein [Marinobacterium arenosum]